MDIPIPTSVRMPLRGSRPAKIFTQIHGRVYMLTGGRLGARLHVPGIENPPVLVLTTVGRRSGKLRTTPLIYLADGDRLLVMASNGGDPRTPAWWLNLQADPEADVQVGSERRRVRARAAEGTERDALWARLCAFYPPYAEYQADTDRTIPVVVLDAVA